MRRIAQHLVVVIQLMTSIVAWAGTTEELVTSSEKYIGEVVAKDELAHHVYRDARIESIYARLQRAFVAANYPLDQIFPIRVNDEGLTGAVGHALFISRAVLAYDDDTVAFVVGHEMTHLVMRDQDTASERILALAAERTQCIDFVSPDALAMVNSNPAYESVFRSVLTRVGQSLVTSASADVTAPVVTNQIAVVSQIIAATTRSNQPLALDVMAYLRLVREAHDEGVLPKAFYQSHESRADRVGALMAIAAGYQPTREHIRGLLYDLGGMPEDYEHPAADVRVAALDFLK